MFSAYYCSLCCSFFLFIFDRLMEEMATMTDMVMVIPVVLTLMMTMVVTAQIMVRTPSVARRIVRKAMLRPWMDDDLT